MNRLRPKQRLQIVEIYFQNQCSVKNVFRALRSSKNILPFYGVHYRPTERTIRDVRKDGSQSIRRRSQALCLSYGTLWRILERDLDFKAYEMVQHATQHAKPSSY